MAKNFFVIAITAILALSFLGGKWGESKTTAYTGTNQDGDKEKVDVGKQQNQYKKTFQD